MAFKNGQRMSAEEAGRGSIGICPWTRMKVKACVGPKVQFWAYEGGQPPFDDGYELDQEWHLAWKSLVTEESCEAIVGEKERYLADIYVQGEYVIELQKEPISEEGAKKRLAYYSSETGERVIYLIDISDFWQRRFKLGASAGNNKYHVEWKPKRGWIMALAKSKDAHVYCDFNHNSDKLLKIWVYKKHLYASFMSKQGFIEKYLNPVLKPQYHNIDNLALSQVRIPSSV